jgi:predicted nucleic acid-binding protein
MTGLTFDTGALIALERRRARVSGIYAAAVATGRIVTVPTAVICEWWRGRTDTREHILRGIRVETVDVPLAQLAGEALAAVKGASAIDALVMASAARRGDIVYTSDVRDLEALRAYFPMVRVLSV